MAGGRNSTLGGLSLGGLLMGDAVYCGTLLGCSSDDLFRADLSWAFYRLAEHETEAVLADFFADWLLEQVAKPVDDLISHKRASLRSRPGITDGRPF